MAFAETLAIELAGTGVDVTLAEPGTVSSGALDDVLTYSLPDDPYAAVLAGEVPVEMMVTPEFVATALADLVELEAVPLRVPIGPMAAGLLAAREVGPFDRPFVPGG